MTGPIRIPQPCDRCGWWQEDCTCSNRTPRPHPSRRVQMAARTERARAEKKAAERAVFDRAASARIAAELAGDAEEVA